MPKDRERYRYIDVGLERGSWTLAMFEEDARRHQMSDQPGKLITLRLTEYYEMKKEREVISSREPLVAAGNDHLSRSASSESRGDNESVRRQEEDVLEISHRAGQNADEAAEYWASL
jgi:hypothetical protein